MIHHAFAGINEQEGSRGTGSTRDHIFEEFLVTWSIDDGVGTFLSAEENTRGIDGDVLLLFFEESIEQERIFKVHAFGGTVATYLFDFSIRQ